MKLKELMTVILGYEDFEIHVVNPKNMIQVIESVEKNIDDIKKYKDFEVEHLEPETDYYGCPFLSIYVIGESK